MNRYVIVTGATSMIGFSLVNLLLKNGYYVTAIIRPFSARADIFPSHERLTVIKSQLNRLSHLTLPNNTYDIFYHIAWDSGFKNSRDNIEGQMRNVIFALEAAQLSKKYGCNTFFSVGSQAECGRVSARINSTTSDCPENAYAIAKCRTYDQLLTFCEQNNIRFCWPRLLSAYGPYDRPHTLIMSCIEACRNKVPMAMTPCEQIWDYIYASDVANAFYQISQKGIHGKKYSVSSGIGRPLKEYVRNIASAMNYMELLDGIGQIAYSSNQVMYLWGDIKELTEDTGFVPRVNFQKGINNTINDLLI